MGISKEKEKQIMREIMGEKGMEYDNSLMENLVSEMWADAKKKGYKSLKGYLAHYYKHWDDEMEASLVDELYESFLEAVQRSALHRGEDEFWSFKNRFEDWLVKCKENLHKRLLELDEDYESKIPSFSAYLDLFPAMDNIQGDLGKALEAEDYDFYHMVMRKTLETIKKLLKNTTLIDIYLRKRDEIYKDGKIKDGQVDD